MGELHLRFPELKLLTEPIDIEKYSYGVFPPTTDQDSFIDLAKENKSVSQYIQFVQNWPNANDAVELLIVPGFVPPTSKPVQLHFIAKQRLNSGVKHLLKNERSVLFLSGGNVKPHGTPFNEAMEMKKYLMKIHKVPEHRIAIDPNAQNTVTNLRNAGRFMLAHKILHATVITTFVQNLYIGVSWLPFFKRRSQKLLGYPVGKTHRIDLMRSTFEPSTLVMTRDSSAIDP